MGDSEATVWGAHLDSERRVVTIEPGKRWTLVLATSRILSLGYCCAALLARLLGCWNFQLGFRRCGLCLLDLSYKWVQKKSWSWTIHQLPHGVADELRLLVALCVYWETDLSALIGSSCFMSDATLEVGAVVQAELTEEEQVFLWHRARRGGLTTRLSPETAWGETLPSPDPVYAPDPLLHAWMLSADAAQVCSYRFRGQHHINVQEMLAYRKGGETRREASPLVGLSGAVYHRLDGCMRCDHQRTVLLIAFESSDAKHDALFVGR